MWRIPPRSPLAAGRSEGRSSLGARSAFDGRERLRVLFAGPDANHPLERLDEDLPVADVARPGRLDQGVDGGVDERIRDGDLNLHLLVELDDVRAASVGLDDAALAAVAADARDRDASHAGCEQRLLHGGKAFGTDDGGNQLHRDAPQSPAPTTTGSRRRSSLL